MADNYCQFSEQMPLETEEQKEWVRSFQYLVERYKREEKPYEGLTPEEIWDRSFESSYGCVGFDSVVDEGGWWIYAEEFGDPGAAAEAVQDFMCAFKIKKPFIINWASWCSKPRLGEFYGGAVVITPRKIAYINASDIASVMVNKITTLKKKAARKKVKKK